MNYTVGQSAWLPVLIQDSSGNGITGIAYNATGLSVKYCVPGGTAQNLALASSNWQEVGRGMYLVLFTSTVLSTLGTFLYWVTCTGYLDYQGWLNISPDFEAIAMASGDEVGTVAWTHVVMKNGSPVEGATVSYYSDAGRTDLVPPAGTTDANGAATFLLAPGHYWVTVSITGDTDRLGEEDVH
jgi:hypothetical protein